MKFRFFSDLHLEHDVAHKKRASIADLWVPPPLPGESDTVLILAGDIWNGVRPLRFKNESWIAGLSNRFKAVVVILGNHDFWGANVTKLTTKWRNGIAEAGLENVHLLELADGPSHGSIVIDGIRVLGSTLWTDMGNYNPLVSLKFDHENGGGGRSLWNDRNFIRAEINYIKFSSKHWLQAHRNALKNLALALEVGDEPVLLVTHHAPCLRSADSRANASDPLSQYLYASDLSNLILDHPRIRQVIHGHTHAALDYFMGDVRVRCNPRGYSPLNGVVGFDSDGTGQLDED